MRIYRVPIPATSITVAVDLVELVGATAGLEWLTEIRLGQTTELGDAAEEQIGISLVTGHTTSGSGGNTSVVPLTDVGDTAYAGTVESLNTTQASAGTAVTKMLGMWNVRTEFLWMPVPKPNGPAGLLLPHNERWVIRLNAAPADAVTVSGYVEFMRAGSA
jgi:hypothetical protein